MAEPKYTVNDKKGSVTVNIPAAWKTEIEFTFRKTYKQVIAELWKQGKGGQEKAETYHTNDRPGELFRSRAYTEEFASVLTLEFSHTRGAEPSAKLNVLTERKSNVVVYTVRPNLLFGMGPNLFIALWQILSSDESPSPATTPDSSDQYAVVTLTNTKAPPTDGKPTDGKPTDGKPTDGKSTDGKPTDGKPTDGKPTDRKPDDKDEKPQLDNVQAEIVPGLNKAFQHFLFFQIDDVAGFRDALDSKIIPKISTADKVFDMLKKKEFPPSGLPDNKFEYVGCSVGFSSRGLAKLGLTDYLYDEAFQRGQQRDAKDLGDKGKETPDGTFEPDWESGFLKEIHGVFQITAHNESKGKAFYQQLKRDFAYSGGIQQVYYMNTKFRPAPNTRQEHFGFRDGIAKPEYKGYTFDNELPIRFAGAPVVDPGLILMGRKGDPEKDRRPAWAVDGSFFVFRKLKQFVPEFHTFLQDKGTKMFPTLSPDDASHKLGARLFGRWKSGTPVVLSPDRDDTTISDDDKRINNFQYPSDQKTCPFAAHTQKSYPRNNLPGSNDHLFRRASIPYGEEVVDEEKSRTQTQIDRGLIFLCYQSSIERGFKYIQQRLSNPDFPSANLTAESPGHDAVIGTAERRSMTGANPADPKERLTIHQRFVEARGGEYFFMPSMATLNKIAKSS
ncbi:hypothetical protein PQX77_012973 [Marasmius sp. AFHP31]|nr:hypothetical protein PQX77_012973 [Marasmius sp. AFHP31]